MSWRDELLATCRGCAASQACPADGRDIVDHANERKCPRGLFTPVQKIPGDFDPEVERRRLKQSDCCGRPRATSN